MSDYIPPLNDIRFMLDQAGLAEILHLGDAGGEVEEVIEAILEEAGKVAKEVIAPLNAIGDRVGATWKNGAVTTAPGWRHAYDQLRQGGWTALTAPAAYGGQELPLLVATAVAEMWQGASLAFSLGPMLTLGGVELLIAHGSDEQKQAYLGKLATGEWMATMDLTEPQAGSDLSQVRTRALPTDDGRYSLRGQKIFISYGEHDLTDNIVHFVLARLPDAPEGTKGISLFAVPKYLLNADGSPGRRNGVTCASIEHKLGIRGSPTAVMLFGEGEEAIGELVGERHQGLVYMFTMMNNARLGVGVQGLGIAERAYQRAAAYAAERRQGGGSSGAAVPIIAHPDVRRMVATMKAQIVGVRGIIYLAAAQLDRADRDSDASNRAKARALGELLIPVAKAWGTQVGCEVADLSIQVHGGMGYIEETGAAQDYRDARILPIYEGTNGIQALDLLRRKVIADRGAATNEFFQMIAEDVEALRGSSGDGHKGIANALEQGLERLRRTTDDLMERSSDHSAINAAASPYLQLFSLTAAAWIHARNALADSARRGSSTLPLAQFFMAQILPFGAVFAEIALGSVVLSEDAILLDRRLQ